MHGSDPLSTDYQLVKLNAASTALDGSITPALEPVAYLYVSGEHRGVRLHKCTEMSLPTNTIEQGLITTDQAKAYADAMVREALEEAAEIADSMNAFLIYNAICALIPK